MVAWDRTDTVLLDMDGTLLDLRFDNHFWQEHVPMRYAERHGLPGAEAREQLAARYRKVEGTLDWYCVDYWSRELELDIAQLKREVDHLIGLHDHAHDFLLALRGSGKRLWLATNAHRKALALKLARTGVGEHFEKIVCAHDFGAPKETPTFWERLHGAEPFDPQTTLLIDDSLPVLRAARDFGVAQLIAITRPDSTRPEKAVEDFPAVTDLRPLMPR